MALAERAELVARLSLRDDFSGKLKGVSRSVSKLGVDMGKIGKMGSQGLSNAAKNLGRIGVVAGGIVALGVKTGIASLADLEDAVTSVDGAIKQMGKGWTTTGQTVATWANEIEAATDAAFDDKAITQAATTLIRFGKVSEENLRPALAVMTDLATKTGDVDSAAALLAKALADPEKAAGKLARTGIVLTKQQQDQIKAMVKAGDVAGAQAFLLGELEKATKDAAKAMHGPYRDALNILSDSTEDAQRLLAEGFLPVLGKVAQKLRTAVGDPKFMAQVKEFGQTLAGAFDKLIDIGGKIPWEQVGTSLKIAGAGAKAVFDAFTSLPPWVQTAVLTGWGLNKLSGGMLGGIVGELGKGLIRGVLGMNAGVVNINAARVNGGGPGAPAAAGGGGAALFAAALAPGISAAIQSFLIAEIDKPGGARETLGVTGSLTPAIGFGGLPALIGNFGTYVEAFGKGVDAIRNPQGPGASVLEVRDNQHLDATMAVQAKLDQTRDAIERNRIAIVSKTEALRATEDRTRAAIDAARISTNAVNRTGDAAVAQAIRAKDLSVKTNVTVPVSVKQYVNGRLFSAATSRFLSSVKVANIGWT